MVGAHVADELADVGFIALSCWDAAFFACARENSPARAKTHTKHTQNTHTKHESKHRFEIISTIHALVDTPYRSELLIPHGHRLLPSRERDELSHHVCELPALRLFSLPLLLLVLQRLRLLLGLLLLLRFPLS